jgi:glycosyltransferase involved in cell wall biosynthesis
MTLSCSFPGETGTPLHAMGIVRQLKKAGVDIFVVQFKGRAGIHITNDLFEGIPVYHIPFPLGELYLIKLLMSEKPDIVHCQHVSAAITSFLPAKILKMPHVYEAHSFWVAETEMLGHKKGIFFYRNKIGEEYILRHGDKIIVMSETMRQEFIKRGAPEEKLHLIYPSTDLEQFSERNVKSVEIEGVTDDDLVVIYTGNFWPWQGVDILLDAIPYVVTEIPNVKFVIIGGKENEIDDKKEKIGKYRDNVIFIGRQPYEIMPSFMTKADILVIPRPESQVNWTTPRKMGEYLAMGKAIVATDVGDHKRILVDNDCGVVTEPNAKRFAEGLIEVLKDEELRKRLGSNARNVAYKLFNWDRAVEKTMNIYKSLVS